MKRKIIKINDELCNGCGACVPDCAEGALQIVDGKAKLVSDFFCDGLGACLGSCPVGAIEIEEREAEPFDEQKVMEKTKKEEDCGHGHLGGGCPGSRAMTLKPVLKPEVKVETQKNETGPLQSQLGHWPVQIHLLSPHSPFLKNADLMIIADCVAFAYANTHEEFIKGKAVAIGCPKLDDAGAYVEKIANIIQVAKPKSITIVRMEVPCCGGMTEIVKQAMKKADEIVPFSVQVISISGEKL
ncbi:MAG TPA: 4Fe-4S dicluster domain-containing protein [bacterium]|nr:4Fe-4S dicluster domain-containing protein [bacterium]